MEAKKPRGQDEELSRWERRLRRLEKRQKTDDEWKIAGRAILWFVLTVLTIVSMVASIVWR